MSRFVNWRQAEILAERYFAVMLGDMGSTFLLLLQVPVIGGFICLAWGEAKADPKLTFCLCLAAIWVGCMNACREIVKERALYERERMVNLEIPAYVVSKLQILSIFNALQCAALLWMVTYHVGLPGNKLFLFLALWLGAMTGTTLGLCISAAVSSSNQAVGLVPIVMIPQIIFTKMILPEGNTHGMVETLEKLNPLRWTLDLYQRIADFARDSAWSDCFKDTAALLAFVAAFFIASLSVLWMQEE